MRTRSRTRAALRQQHSKDDNHAPMNITVNIHIHVNQEVVLLQSGLPEPQPRYLTRLQRQRLSTQLSTSKLCTQSGTFQSNDNSARRIEHTVTKPAPTQRRPVVENPKAKRRRVDVDSLMVELTSMSMGARPPPLQIGYSTAAMTTPRNPFNIFTPQPDVSRFMDRCQLQPTPTDELSDAVASMQLCHVEDDMDATLTQFTSLSLQAPSASRYDDSHFLHHLLEKRLSLHGP
ncbi:hypothetical protein DYB37_010762 [Aphanomyces astaci]|uniref:Uncharacterized protein n=1 Tax=Aphanomyces astaci TaxID=112090 RepID=A0A3R7EAJ0_APHAT|nr:hypothetical protein DYB35_010503 [Aphanomyces astaci]RHZ29599.1 hypothetical protein DYB37_010762 [Aphanomyces astaci]